MAKILITGAGGFIGSFMVEEAIRRGFETWAGVRPTTDRRYLTDSRIRFVNLSFENSTKLQTQLIDAKREFGGWDVVIHNLGLTKESRKGEFEQVNYQYVRNLIEAMRITDSMPKHFVYMSSLAAYGVGDESGKNPLTLSDKPHPTTEYGKSKLKAEQYIQSLPKFPYTILRPTGVYGPREKDYLMMIRTIKNGIDIAAGFQPQLLTFIYVKDLATVALDAIEKKAVQKHYFVADGDVYSGKDFRQICMKFLPKRFVLSLTLPLFLIKTISLCAQWIGRIRNKPSTLNSDKYQIMKQRNWACDISQLQHDLGFVPQYDLERGLEETIDWYKKEKWL